MKQFPEMWIPCTEQEYPEVKQLLEGMGCTEFDSYKIHRCKGVETYRDGDFQVLSRFSPNKHPTVTLPELREIARAHAAANEKWSPEPINDHSDCIEDAVPYGTFTQSPPTGGGMSWRTVYEPQPTDELRLLKERVGIMERSIMGMETKINEIHKLLFEE